KKNKTFFLDQHGCAKNQVDGELIISRLIEEGYVRTDEPSEASVIIINSCGFIESAKKESLDSLLNARTAYPDAKIILAGCLAERYADVFKEQLPEADAVFGNGDISRITDVVGETLKGNRTVVKPEQEGVSCGDRKQLLNFKGSAFVKITEGCDNRCTFCAIPIIRGSLRSRKADDIIAEIKKLLSEGVFEINLIGQDLAAYGCGKTDDVFSDGRNGWDYMYTKLRSPLFEQKEKDGLEEKKSFLCELIEKISLIKGNFWVRLLYIHPDHFDTDILHAMKKDPRFLPYFDIPFQSGSSPVIKAMNRKGSAASYKRLVSKIREVFPESSIRTTFLTGFPGETEEDALATKKFLSAIKSDWSGCFSYSREDDTPAAKFKDRVPKRVAQKRADELTELQNQITASLLAGRTGKVYDVLVEEVLPPSDDSGEGLAIGRAWFCAPEVDGSVVIRYDCDDKKVVASIVPGKVVKVKVLSSGAVDVDGEYCGS
ncbi:MAG: 30S ribosomal protein S12 methylthiotransferase RimO, partial [Treponema sp.]|nr:30S ribosomal protein S12 methylthiotransferase RimO [Treponema sp.]